MDGKITARVTEASLIDRDKEKDKIGRGLEKR